MITDEQVKLAANIYIGMPVNHPIANGNMTDMRKTLEAYEQSKWVKFDRYDKTTYPPVSKYSKEYSDRLLMAVNGEVVSGYCEIYKGRPTFTDESEDVQTPTHWQPLPEFKE